MHNMSVACEIAEAIAGYMWMTGAHAFQVTLCTAIVIAIAYVFLNRKISETTMHVNLKITFTQVLILYCIFCAPRIVILSLVLIRYQTYADPCSLLYPPWISALAQGPYHLLLVACPCWHLATTLERTYATYKAHCYEKSSASYGIWSSVAVWWASLTYAGCVVYLALTDEEFQEPQPTMSLATRSTQFVPKAMYVTLVADLLTSFADFLLLRWNLWRLKSVMPSYSLSRSYQTNENIAVTTRLVLPLSFSNTAFYVLYLIAVYRTRYGYSNVLNDPTPNPLVYRNVVCVYEWIITLLMLQMLVAISVLLRFCKRRPRTVSIAKKSEEYELYIQQFRQHW